jgi:hypothetical protein
MNGRHLVTVLFALAGGAVGVLLAHWAGVESWPDAKMYIVCGVTAGFLVVKFLGWLLRNTSLTSNGDKP